MGSLYNSIWDDVNLQVDYFVDSHVNLTLCYKVERSLGCCADTDIQDMLRSKILDTVWFEVSRPTWSCLRDSLDFGEFK